jgi:hypothetical protein
MPANRGGRVPRPAVGGQWGLRFLKTPAVTGWEELWRQTAEAAARAHEWLSDDPRRRTDRNHPLKGELKFGDVRGRQCERWQHEVTGAGRIWFLIDDDSRTVWLEVVSIGHP